MSRVIYEKPVYGRIDWFDDSKEFGVITLFKSIPETGLSNSNELFIHWKGCDKVAPHINEGEIIYCENVVCTPKVAGNNWRLIQWEQKDIEQFLLYISSILPEHQNDVMRGFLLIRSSDFDAGIDFNSILLDLKSQLTEDSFDKIIRFLISVLVHSSKTSTLYRDVCELLNAQYTWVKPKDRIYLSKYGIIDYDALSFERIKSWDVSLLVELYKNITSKEQSHYPCVTDLRDYLVANLSLKEKISYYTKGLLSLDLFTRKELLDREEELCAIASSLSDADSTLLKKSLRLNQYLTELSSHIVSVEEANPKKKLITDISIPSNYSTIDTNAIESIDFLRFLNYEVWRTIRSFGLENDYLRIVILQRLFEDSGQLSRKSFQANLSLIGFLIFILDTPLETIPVMENTSLCLWFYFPDLIQIDISTIYRDFALFSPFQQIHVLRWLFYRRENGEDTINLIELAGLVQGKDDRNDMNLPSYDLSVRFVVSSISSLLNNGELRPEPTLYEIFYESIKEVKGNICFYDDLFARCDGRTKTYIDNTKATGEITKKELQNGVPGRFYYRIDITAQLDAERHQELIKEIEKLPRCKRNPGEEEWWAVSAYSWDEIIVFARNNGFYLVDEDYQLNKHLSNYTKTDNVEDKLCDGRPFHDTWWCAKGICQEPSFSHSSCKDWTRYTFIDFCRILEISLDDTKNGKNVPLGKYIQFAGHLNRFRDLQSHLFCDYCKQIMYPAEVSNSSIYSVTRFKCNNSFCRNTGAVVYLNRCLACRRTIDSRTSKQCPNGWYICGFVDCGACCSTEVLSRIAPFQEGHFDKSIHFCPHCGVQMKYYRGKITCLSCGYTLSNYRYRIYH